MEALKMNVFVVVMVAMLVMVASGVSAADAPAPSPVSDATTLFVPTAFASLIALAFGFLF
ncbi:arabinogalactan protein 14 [Cicer arietinum]|uniref:Arabinogalactan protein 14 n=2 Tax=Cicer arietinum TaxID=3827 RepID=A0A1S2XR01_CICAR|nr:arabinogalactan protein 14 [Cicer arietinum]